jgi:hypothetical protein
MTTSPMAEAWTTVATLGATLVVAGTGAVTAKGMAAASRTLFGCGRPYACAALCRSVFPAVFLACCWLHQRCAFSWAWVQLQRIGCHVDCVQRVPASISLDIWRLLCLCGSLGKFMSVMLQAIHYVATGSKEKQGARVSAFASLTHTFYNGSRAPVGDCCY